jgi:glutaredoxin 3
MYIKNMPTVTIFTMPTCGFCKMAKDYLTTKNVSFKEVDITKNLNGMNWVLDHTGQSKVPVIKIDSEIITGFDREKIDDVLSHFK